ncbi:MAG TPA: hypothetical protein VMN82_01745 [Thermoanaerobaculia bacterium]|nr:hypothetical protein [Thermoanaerobaculia bacterium]
MAEGYPHDMISGRQSVRRVRALLGAALLALPAAASLLAADAASPAAAGLEWTASPYRHFGDARVAPGGRAVVFDEVDDADLVAGVGQEVRRLETELFDRQGWRVPFAETEPLRVYVARGPSGGVRAVAARSVEKGRLVAPAVLLDASGMATGAIVREVARQIARATLDGYGVDDAFLSPALAEFLSAPPGESGAEAAWASGAAGTLAFRAEPATLGRLWVDEIARAAGGPVALRDAWQRAAELGESPTAVLVRAAAQDGHLSEESVLVRAAARLYASVEPEASPSRLRLLDVTSGAIDAAPPATLTVRHRTFLPETDDTLKVAWPQDGGTAAAVVRYQDAALPPDVVAFGPGDTRAIPLSGVARVDWVVAGGASGGRGIAAPVSAELSTTLPYSGLEARGSGEGGPRLTWTTASHDGLWGWAVFREEVQADGKIARTGPEIVPSAESSSQSYRYEFVDAAAASGTYYRYTVWAVTSEGLLARAFSATLKASD